MYLKINNSNLISDEILKELNPEGNIPKIVIDSIFNQEDVLTEWLSYHNACGLTDREDSDSYLDDDNILELSCVLSQIKKESFSEDRLKELKKDNENYFLIYLDYDFIYYLDSDELC